MCPLQKDPHIPANAGTQRNDRATYSLYPQWNEAKRASWRGRCSRISGIHNLPSARSRVSGIANDSDPKPAKRQLRAIIISHSSRSWARPRVAANYVTSSLPPSATSLLKAACLQPLVRQAHHERQSHSRQQIMRPRRSLSRGVRSPAVARQAHHERKSTCLLLERSASSEVGDAFPSAATLRPHHRDALDHLGVGQTVWCLAR